MHVKEHFSCWTGLNRFGWQQDRLHFMLHLKRSHFLRFVIEKEMSKLASGLVYRILSISVPKIKKKTGQIHTGLTKFLRDIYSQLFEDTVMSV